MGYELSDEMKATDVIKALDMAIDVVSIKEILSTIQTGVYNIVQRFIKKTKRK